MMTVTIEIPALERLCAILEQRDRGNIMAELQAEIVKQLEAAAGTGTLEKAAKTEPAPEAREAPQEPPKAKADKKPAAKPEPTQEAKPATLADIQKAAAQMRDDGRLQEVKDLFPEYGIKKLSDLKADQLQAFAERLRGMGARI